MLVWAGQLCFPWSQTSPLTIAFSHPTNNCSKKKAGKSMWTKKCLSNNNKKYTCYDWQVSGIICEGQHLLHSRIFIKLTTKIDPNDFEWGYLHHAVIYKTEATEREASIKIHTGKLYLIQLDGRDKGSQWIVQGSKIYPQRDRRISSHVHVAAAWLCPETFHALRMTVCLLGGGMTSEWKVKLYPIEWNRTLFCL